VLKRAKKVSAIEPNPQYSDLLRANLKLNVNSVEVLSYAVGEIEGKAKFKIGVLLHHCLMRALRLNLWTPLYLTLM